MASTWDHVQSREPPERPLVTSTIVLAHLAGSSPQDPSSIARPALPCKYLCLSRSLNPSTSNCFLQSASSLTVSITSTRPLYLFLLLHFVLLLIAQEAVHLHYSYLKKAQVPLRTDEAIKALRVRLMDKRDSLLKLRGMLVLLGLLLRGVSSHGKALTELYAMIKCMCKGRILRAGDMHQEMVRLRSRIILLLFVVVWRRGRRC